MAVVLDSPGPLGFITINLDPVLHHRPAADPLVRNHVRDRVPRRLPVRRAAVCDATRASPRRSPRRSPSGRSSSDCSADACTTSSSSRTSGTTTCSTRSTSSRSGRVAWPSSARSSSASSTLAICAWRYGYNPWIALDGGVLFAVVGQPIGRIGNIINGDILGAPSTLPWATAYTNPNAILQSCCRLGVAVSAGSGVRGNRHDHHRRDPVPAAAPQARGPGSSRSSMSGSTRSAS